MEQNFKYFKNSLDRIYCNIRYFQDGNLLVVTWKGTASEQSIKEVKESILQMIREHHCTAILNDVQDFYSTPTAVLAGLTVSDWDKEVRRLGVHQIAHVLKQDHIPSKTEVTSTPGLTIKFFTEKLEALTWLKH